MEYNAGQTDAGTPKIPQKPQKWHLYSWGFLCPEGKCKKVQEAGSGISACIAIIGPNCKPSEDCASQKHPANTTHEASLNTLKTAGKKSNNNKKVATAEYSFRCTRHRTAVLPNTVFKIGMAVSA